GTTIPMRFRNPKLSGTLWPSFEKSIACDAIASQVIDKSDRATVAVTDVKTSEIFGLVSNDASAAPGGFVGCDRPCHPPGSSITCICGIVSPARNFFQDGRARFATLRRQGSVFCAKPLALLRTRCADRT